METTDLKSYLKFEVIWKDDDIIELKVSSSNIDFYGTTEVYDTSESLYDFSQQLMSFPKNEKIIFYELGRKDGYSYCSVRFYCIDNLGHIGVEVTLESNVESNFRIEKKNKMKLEVIVEPSAIDNFLKALSHVALKRNGMAILYGSDNRINN